MYIASWRSKIQSCSSKIKDIVDQPVRTALTLVHNYNSTQYCSTETVFLIYPFLQTNIISRMWPSGGKGGSEAINPLLLLLLANSDASIKCCSSTLRNHRSYADMGIQRWQHQLLHYDRQSGNQVIEAWRIRNVLNVVQQCRFNILLFSKQNISFRKIGIFLNFLVISQHWKI